MMSSEEESDSHGSSADGLLKKQKRARQRVDAGEPRNSYSSIPNFTSRPAAGAGFMSGGIYGAVFNQARHFGASGPGPGALYPPAKMLNELLGRAPKQEADEDGGVAGAGGELAHHVLRDILQGRKKELRQLERELRLAAGAASPASPASPASSDNNNVLANNNNDEPKDKCALALRHAHAHGHIDSRAADEAVREALADAAERHDLLDDSALCLNGAADSRSLPSPPSVEELVAPKLEPEEPDKERSSPTPSRCDKPLEVKRARVENIVSTMRSSPVPPTTQPQVNGCKKRKLYHPQQHDGGAAAAERYLHGAQAQQDDSEEDSERQPFQQKIVEKNALKSQLRSMQEQLAEMQEKYVQLCNRMEHESKTMDDDDALSSEAELLDDTPDKPSSPASPKKPESPVAASGPPPDAGVLSHVVGKMMANRHPHPHSLPPGFNGALPLVPHLPHMPHDHHPLHPQHPHHNINSAAAMYLNVSQKLFMEQEQARIAKEHADSLAAHHQQQHHPQLAPPRPQSRQRSPTPRPPTGPPAKPPSISSELAERLDALRNNVNSATPVSVSGAELEGLAEVLKNEIAASLTSLVDSIVTRFVHQRRYLGKQSEAAAAAADRLNKDLLLASRLLERKSPGVGAGGAGVDKDRACAPQGPMPGNAPLHHIPNSNASLPNGVAFVDHNAMMSVSINMNGPRQSAAASFPLHEVGGHPNQNPHARPPTAMFQAPKPPPGINHALFNGQPFCVERENPEQNEALSLVVTPKKKRHKVTDTRITPRTVSRILGEGLGPSPAPDKFPDSPPPRPYCGPGGLALPTSVAIANPSLHESQVFSPYSPFFGAGGMAGMGMRGPGAGHSPPAPLERDSPPLPHAPALLHPALLAAAHRASSTPDYLRAHHLHASAGMDQQDPHSDCNSTDITYDGIQPTSSTLTPMHLRKAKLMFFWVRYPSSAVLKMYFPDIKFNKNNTAQLVKWFSNFREFYYIQMEKYARQAISEGAKSADELHVAGDSEIYRVLNLHYNRNNHIEVPSNFRYVVEQTLREFYRAIQGGKDSEQSWKKSIYKIISRLDDPVPEYFKSPNFLEQLE